MYEWDLDSLYNGVDSPKFKEDYKKLQSLLNEMKSFDFSKQSDIDTLKAIFKLNESFSYTGFNLMEYLSLRLSVNSKDKEAIKNMGIIDNLLTGATSFSVKYMNYIRNYDSLIEDASNDEYLKNYIYVLKKDYDQSKRTLSDETEVLLSKLSRSSGSAWERLFDTLTSSVKANYRGELISLPVVRNLAYSEDPEVRKDAYEAEIKCYAQIEDAIAACLSSIKEEVTTMCEARGYDSPIDKTLKQTGMTMKTLSALTEAIEEYYPAFRMYLKRKGVLLGYKNGLPFYDLFAPMGKLESKYTVEECNKYLLDRFSSFNKDIASLMEKAMSNNWIDYMPKDGKVGGAFCADAESLKESRILTNFDGTFNAVVTLAHELGHAYHSEVLKNESLLLKDYPMQLAETASTFNESFIKNCGIENASSFDEKLNLLEATIADDTQVIVDIMSRYYFENSVFEGTKESALTPEDLCTLMKDAQLRSYGDGLDKDFLHPYMWCCKGHYYSTGLSFYNFPYAFGQLFAYGLYSKYQKEGDKFFDTYKEILLNSGKMPIRECVLLAGIDVEDKEFWKSSLEICKARIDEFMSMTEELVK